MRVYEVQVVEVRSVVLRGESSGAGVAGGAITGGVLGSFVGLGKANALATVGGALVGAVAGHEIERRAKSGAGLEITVRTPSGQNWVVVQADHGENFRPGEWVRMLVGGESRNISR